MPSQENKKISPLLISKKGTGHRSGSDSIQKNKQFRTALLHSNNYITPYHTGDGRTPVREGMLHFLSHLFSKQRLPASLSVEAAVVLPLFIAAMCLLMYPMRVMNSQIEAQVCMEQAGELVSAAEAIRTSVGTALKQEGAGGANSGNAAASEQAGTSGEKLPVDSLPQGTGGVQAAGSTETAGTGRDAANTKINKALSFTETLGSGAAIFAQFDTEVLGIPIITELKTPDEKDPCTEIHVSCFVTYPFSDLVGSNFSIVRLVSRRRAWIGREGGAGRAYGEKEENTGAGTEEQDTIVYVARNSVNSGRYHTKATCHYISNTMTAVNAAGIADLRSSDGGKYHACPSCKPASTGTVYIFKSGNAYHASKDCKAIQSYAVEVPLKEAKERGLTQCTYCSRSQ